MDEKLPDNITRFDLIKINHDTQRLCKCFEPHFEIDLKNRMVRCIDCNAFVDPFYAFQKICEQEERWDNIHHRKFEERKQIDSYKPHLVTIKELERIMRANKGQMLPHCPRCGETFEVSDLLYTTWTNRRYCTGSRPKEEAGNETHSSKL